MGNKHGEEKKKRTISNLFDGIRKAKSEKTVNEPKKRSGFGRKKKTVEPVAPLLNFVMVDGLIHITVKKTARNDSEWLKNAISAGRKVHPYTKYDYLICLDFQFDTDEFELVVFKQEQLEDHNQFIENATQFALSNGYKIPDPEMACFLLDAMKPEDFEAMGLKSIQVAHDPIEWKDVLLIKYGESAAKHQREEVGPIQFVVGLSSTRTNSSKHLEIHSAPFNQERRIVKTRGIAFLVPKK